MSIQKVVDALNAAFAADPGAIRALMVNRVPCNMALANDPYVVVEEDRNLEGDHFSVGTLGVINGVLAAAGLPIVAAKWDMREDGPNVFSGFMAYIQPKPVCVADQSPQPDQYWQHKTSGDRVYFIGRTPECTMVWQCEGDNVEIGDLEWYDWEYLPGCTGWGWKPEPAAVKYPQWYVPVKSTISHEHGVRIAYLRRDSETSGETFLVNGKSFKFYSIGFKPEELYVVMEDEAKSHVNPPVTEQKFPLYVKDCCGMIFRADSRDRIFWLPIDGGEYLQLGTEDFWNKDSELTPLTESQVCEILNRSVKGNVKAPSDVMGQSPDDWVILDEKYDECPLLPGYQYRVLAYANDWKTIDSRDTLCGELIKCERKDSLGDWEFRCRRSDLPVVNARIPVALYWYDGAIVGRYADSPVTDPSFVPIHSDSNGGWFIERS